MALEKDFYARLTAYYTDFAKRTGRSVAWEAKRSLTARVRFDSVSAHQERNLLAAEDAHGFKIPDNGIGLKPYDGYVIAKAYSVVVLIYYKPRESEVYEIPVRTWVNERYASKEKSITKERACAIGKRIVI